jgi:hypothetical protein
VHPFAPYLGLRELLEFRRSKPDDNLQRPGLVLVIPILSRQELVDKLSKVLVLSCLVFIVEEVQLLP